MENHVANLQSLVFQCNCIYNKTLLHEQLSIYLPYRTRTIKTFFSPYHHFPTGESDRERTFLRWDVLSYYISFPRGSRWFNDSCTRGRDMREFMYDTDFLNFLLLPLSRTKIVPWALSEIYRIAGVFTFALSFSAFVKSINEQWVRALKEKTVATQHPFRERAFLHSIPPSQHVYGAESFHCSSSLRKQPSIFFFRWRCGLTGVLRVRVE